MFVSLCFVHNYETWIETPHNPCKYTPIILILFTFKAIYFTLLGGSYPFSR